MATGRTGYRKCVECGQSFNKSYFQRHKCSLTFDNPSLELDTNKDTYRELDEIHNSFESHSADDNGNEVNNNRIDNENPELINNEDFDYLFDEMNYSDDEIMQGVNDEEETPGSMLVKWFTIFLAYWQIHFSITDNALTFLLKFLHVFLKKLNDFQRTPILEEILLIIPSSIYKFHKLLKMDGKSAFRKYVVCIKCHSLYELSMCRSKYQGEFITAKCSFKKFPSHRSKHLRKKCGQDLFKTVQCPSGGSMLVPFKTYCYRSIKSSLQMLLKRENFEKDCQLWKKRSTVEGIYTDVYDGHIWKNFKRNGEWYFQHDRNYAVMLNVDWFQPYKHIASFSVGGVYLVLMNLPRTERFKKENVFLVGIIPNMDKEPPTNSFIKPLVDELNEAWENGFNLVSSITKQVETFNVALLCVGCDIPACRKLCGFLGKIFYISNSFLGLKCKFANQFLRLLKLKLLYCRSFCNSRMFKM